MNPSSKAYLPGFEQDSNKGFYKVLRGGLGFRVPGCPAALAPGCQKHKEAVAPCRKMRVLP